MKNWYQSKTILINLAGLMLGILPMVNAKLLTIFGITDVDSYLYVIGLIIGAINLFLRVSKGEQTQEIKFFEEKKLN